MPATPPERPSHWAIFRGGLLDGRLCCEVDTTLTDGPALNRVELSSVTGSGLGRSQWQARARAATAHLRRSTEAYNMQRTAMCVFQQSRQQQLTVGGRVLHAPLPAPAAVAVDLHGIGAADAVARHAAVCRRLTLANLQQLPADADSCHEMLLT